MDKKVFVFFIIFVVIGGIVGILLFNTRQAQPLDYAQDKRVQYDQDNNFQKGIMKITSSAFAHNQYIPSQFTCDGKNINPSLHIADVPQEAKSLVLIMDDPDAPRGTWVHWTVWDIDPKTVDIPENTVPMDATEGVTSFGKPGYGGPCPPSGTHRYFFKLYALDRLIPRPEAGLEKSDLEDAMKGHLLAQTELIGLYKRQ